MSLGPSSAMLINLKTHLVRRFVCNAQRNVKFLNGKQFGPGLFGGVTVFSRILTVAFDRLFKVRLGKG